MAEEAVIETPVAESTPAVETPAPEAPPEPVSTDQSDLFSQLDQLLPQEEATSEATETPVEPQIPEQLQAALGISQFVTSAEVIPQAIQAADEVWKVASGQVPARALLEGFRQANPQQFPAIASDLADYLQSQGLIQAPQNPIEALKASHPQVYNAVAQFVQQQTGKPLDAPQDPYHERLSAIEQSIAAEREQQETAAYNAQVDQARSKASEFITGITKGTFAEGLTDRYVAPNGLLWQKAQQMQIPAEKIMQELNSGKTDTVQKLWKAVEKDEATIIRKFNANLVKQHNTLKNGVPATKGAPVQAKTDNGEFPPYLPNETAVQYYQRVFAAKK